MNRYKRVRQIVAMLTVILIILIVIITLVLGILGSPYYWGFFFISLVVPLILWVFMWFYQIIIGKNNTEESENMEEELTVQDSNLQE